MAFNPSKTTSIVVHRIGDTILVDDFDINSFLLMSSSYVSWHFSTFIFRMLGPF